MPSAGSLSAPPRPAFTPRGAADHRPVSDAGAVQGYLNALPYNNEPPPPGETLRSFRGVVRHGTAHCLEAALAAAVILEQHGYPPLVLSFESIDELDHVIFVYRRRGRWGSVARSRDPGLHGRRPVFATPRALALSYVDPYVDFTGRITGYAVVDLRVHGRLRLAAVGEQRLEGRAHAARLPAPADPHLGRAHRAPAAEVSCLQAGVPGSQAGLLRAAGRWTELPAEWQDVEGEDSKKERGRFYRFVGFDGFDGFGFRGSGFRIRQVRGFGGSRVRQVRFGGSSGSGSMVRFDRFDGSGSMGGCREISCGA